MARLATLAAKHRGRVAAAWIAALVLAMGAAHAAGPHYVTDVTLHGTDSNRARSLLQSAFPQRAGDTELVVWHVDSGRVTAPPVVRRVSAALTRIATLAHVTAVASPYGAGGARTISADGRTAYASVLLDQDPHTIPTSATKRVIAVAEAAEAPGLSVDLGGEAVRQTERPTLGAATAIGLLAAIVVLLVTFGSFAAMGLPILTALLGLGTALGVIGLGSRVLDTPDFAVQLAAMIGLGVGIDYALFIVTRYRERLHETGDVEGSIAAAMDTAGRAVLFAGVTVIIALLGMFVLGVSLLYGVALSAAAGVLLTMTAALTVLPALLTRVGHRLNRSTTRSAEGWSRWAAWVTGHPWPAALAGLAIMLVLAAPALSLRLGQSDAGNDPTSLTTRRAYDRLSTAFGPGFNGPLQVAASLPRTAGRPAADRVAVALRQTPGVASVSAPAFGPSGRTAVFEVVPRTSPQAAATTDLVHRLRERTLPPVESSTRARVYVGGPTAAWVDFSHVLGRKLPLFIALVVILAGLLLAVVFRSVVIPLQAAVMNLLSIAASIGVVVAVFQHGWLGGLFGVKGGPIEAFIPVLLFAIVFGLSMDYEVFLISRIHEEWRRTGRPREAIVAGMASTGRVITAAAVIMCCVFVSFVLGDQRVLKLFGLSLASAVFLDAFVVRSLLLPATLALLDRYAWAMPAWVARRLPRVTIEGPAPQPESA